MLLIFIFIFNKYFSNKYDLYNTAEVEKTTGDLFINRYGTLVIYLAPEIIMKVYFKILCLQMKI